MSLSKRTESYTGVRMWEVGEPIVQSRLNQMVRGINSANGGGGSVASHVRVAQTVADTDASYPTIADNPNVFPFRWVSLTPYDDVNFTSAGRVSLTPASNESEPYGYVLNLAATGAGDPKAYIPEDTVIQVSPCGLGFYVTQYAGGTSTGTLIHAFSPGGGIPAMSGLVMGSAVCTVYEDNGTGTLVSTATTRTFYNPSGLAISGSSHIVAAENEAGNLVVLVEACDEAAT